MRGNIVFVAFLAAMLIVFGGLSHAAGKSGPSYPDYRNWTHVKSMVIEEGHPLFAAFGGIHHVYANRKALQAMKGGAKTFPDGSVLVFDLLEAKKEGGAIVEGTRKFVAVMEKKAARYPATGGWGFAAFRADTKENFVKDQKTECFDCHAGQTVADYVFSTYRK